MSNIKINYLDVLPDGTYVGNVTIPKFKCPLIQEGFEKKVKESFEKRCKEQDEKFYNEMMFGTTNKPKDKYYGRGLAAIIKGD